MDLNPTERLRARLSEADEWRRQLSGELALLPSTIADLRETIADLRTLIGRLEKATVGLEILIRHSESSGLNDLARRVDEASTLLEEQSRAGANLAGAAFEELQKNLTGAAQLLGRLNPPRTKE